ncbi:MAG: hypothetical protein AAF587_02750 [Bacteroidota bacterium]
MNTAIKFLGVVGILSIISCGSGNRLYYESITSQANCQEKDGYWYKGKCWAGFEEMGFSLAEIDIEVDKQMIIIDQAKVTMNGQAHPLRLFFPEQDGKSITLITIFGDSTHTTSILQPIKKKQLNKTSFSSNAILIRGNLMRLAEDEAALTESLGNPLASGEISITVNDLDQLDLRMSGLLHNDTDGQSFQIDYQTHETIIGAGTSTLTVEGDEFHLNGELGTRTYQQLKEAINKHPDVHTLVLGHVPGSLNDEVNMHTGRILREAGLSTKVLASSDIASGGVDLFCAGKERIIEKGAQLGIHSWCCVNELTAVELPKDHPAHQYQIAYFSMCLGESQGPNFYFHTLEAAPFDGVHYMSEEELTNWKIATQWIE